MAFQINTGAPLFSSPATSTSLFDPPVTKLSFRSSTDSASSAFTITPNLKNVTPIPINHSLPGATPDSSTSTLLAAITSMLQKMKIEQDAIDARISADKETKDKLALALKKIEDLTVLVHKQDAEIRALKQKQRDFKEEAEVQATKTEGIEKQLIEIAVEVTILQKSLELIKPLLRWVNKKRIAHSDAYGNTLDELGQVVKRKGVEETSLEQYLDLKKPWLWRRGWNIRE